MSQRYYVFRGLREPPIYAYGTEWEAARYLALLNHDRNRYLVRPVPCDPVTTGDLENSDRIISLADIAETAD